MHSSVTPAPWVLGSPTGGPRRSHIILSGWLGAGEGAACAAQVIGVLPQGVAAESFQDNIMI